MGRAYRPRAGVGDLLREDDDVSDDKATPRPWRVKLFPPTRILEIVSGPAAEPVISWTAFDDRNRPFEEHLVKAELIIAAVNAYDPNRVSVSRVEG